MSDNLRHPIYVNNKVVGHVFRTTFYKSVKGSKHFLRQPPSICTDDQALRDAQRYGAVTMEVTDQETGIRYLASIADIRKFGTRFQRGAGWQIGLGMGKWQIIPPNTTQGSPANALETTLQADFIQPNLFNQEGEPNGTKSGATGN